MVPSETYWIIYSYVYFRRVPLIPHIYYSGSLPSSSIINYMPEPAACCFVIYIQILINVRGSLDFNIWFFTGRIFCNFDYLIIYWENFIWLFIGRIFGSFIWLFTWKIFGNFDIWLFTGRIFGNFDIFRGKNFFLN